MGFFRGELTFDVVFICHCLEPFQYFPFVIKETRDHKSFVFLVIMCKLGPVKCKEVSL